ncbi:MAG: FG-GAP-like repeat-containing protein [candidate division KSB1 bacterium]|nr:FG-GAP-like repeat-containing protein [candidate division KSB1 bacterium]
MSNTYYSCDEFATVITNAQKPWDPNKNTTYHLKIVWDNRSLKYYRDGQLHAWHILQNSMQLCYIYVGRDSTVSGEFVTGFLHNQYPTMSDADGPIYSNLVVKEFRSNETATPVINSPTVVDLYQNAARLSWSTSEAAVCYGEYGQTTAYGQKTTILGPPATSFTTLLSNLNSGTLYHYRITAEDDAGNVAQSGDLTFTTTTNGVYVFKLVADTYIEADDRVNRNSDNPDYPWLYGPTRSEGNYGWMNLMTALYRDSFLQFNVSDVGNIAQATLRLYGRQTSVTGANVRQFTPLQSNWEKNATWTDANTNHQYLNRSVYSSAPLLGSISSTTAGLWHIIDVSAATRDANDNYYFVLQGTGAPTDQNGILAKVSCGSFDSRESTNNQPELIIQTGQPAFTEVSIALPGVSDPALAWGDFDKDGDLDILLTGCLSTGCSGNGSLHSAVWRNDGNGNFVNINAPLQAVYGGAVALGDYDKNNWLDILLTGDDGASFYTKVYQNTNGAFAAISTSLQPVSYNGAAWGNYNNDRHVDILLCGSSPTGGFAKIYKATSTGQWVDSGIALQQLRDADATWADYDKDGDIDVLLSGFTSNLTSKAVVYKNKLFDNGGPNPVSFQLAYTFFPQTPKQCVWVDYDQDGDLDIALAGEIYEKTVNGYEQKNFSIPPTVNGASAWGDYDNDGDLDLLLTGDLNSTSVTRIYRNDPGPNGRTFADISAPFAGFNHSAVAWGDYDNDGDLDILIAGFSNGSRATKLYRNTTSTTNNPPAKPTKPTPSSVVSGNNVTLMCNPSSDDKTAANGLSYNIMMGQAQGGIGTVSPMSLTGNGRRLIPATGNVGSNTSWTMIGLPTGTYHWKVQAIDQTFKGSTFSDDGTFTIGGAKTADTDSVVDADTIVVAQQGIPHEYVLSQNYPNPFNPSTRLNLNLPENGRVKAVVYDMQGQEVVRLRDAEMTAGYKFLDWDGRNAAGAVVSSGTYLVKVIFEGASGARKESTSRILLLK